MQNDNIKLILASGSPRRLELLRQAGIEPEVCAADVQELTDSLPPAELVQRNAELKAWAVAARRTDSQTECILAADTVVALGDEIFGKPLDKADAIDMLRRLSGREHSVFSGVAVWYQGRLQSGVAESRVRFRELTAAEIADYVSGGEPLYKAGADAVQGGARKFVLNIVGDFDNIVGLPLKLTAQLLPDGLISTTIAGVK